MRARWVAGLVLFLACTTRAEIVDVTFVTSPTGARIVTAQGVVGLSGQVIPLDIRADRMLIYIQKDGYEELEVKLEKSDLRSHRYPRKGALYLRPTRLSTWMLAHWPWLALTGGLVGIAAVFGLRSRATLRYERKLADLVASAPSEGTMILQIVGRWRLVEQVGRGGMATVYRGLPAHTLEITEPVAIKVIQSEVSAEQSFRDRFMREIQISKNLVHKNIVRLLDHGTQDGCLYIVQEFLEGGTLRQKVELPVTPERMLEIMTPVFEAVAYAHKQGVIHRDLKPDNIMLTRSQRVVVTDFGLARRDDSENLTQTGAALGTPAYMAPEQIQGSVVQASDQYALGIICYELLKGKPPFMAEDPIQLIFKHLTEEPAPLNTRMDAPILRMLAKDPVDRFPDVVQALEVLRAS